MSRTAQLIVGAVTDFVMTAGATLTGYMMGQGGVVMPSSAMIVLAVIIGAVAAAKQVRGMAMDLKPLVVLLAVSLAVAGCGVTGIDMTKMSAEQLNAFAKMKDAWGGCIVANTPYGRASSVWINADKGVLGKMTIKENCETTIEGPAPK